MKYTEHFNFAKPDDDDIVDIEVLNGNMDLVDAILEDIYSRLGPTPPTPGGYVKCNGYVSPVYKYEINVQEDVPYRLAQTSTSHGGGLMYSDSAYAEDSNVLNDIISYAGPAIGVSDKSGFINFLVTDLSVTEEEAVQLADTYENAPTIAFKKEFDDTAGCIVSIGSNLLLTDTSDLLTPENIIKPYTTVLPTTNHSAAGYIDGPLTDEFDVIKLPDSSFANVDKSINVTNDRKYSIVSVYTNSRAVSDVLGPVVSEVYCKEFSADNVPESFASQYSGTYDDRIQSIYDKIHDVLILNNCVVDDTDGIVVTYNANKLSVMFMNMSYMSNTSYNFSFVEMPDTSGTYTIPFEIPSSWFDDIFEGYDVVPLVVRDSIITNLEIGKAYKLTMYTNKGETFSAKGVATKEDFVAVAFEYDSTEMPSEIVDMFYGGEVTFTIVNAYPQFNEGNSFVLYPFIDTAKNVHADDFKELIDKFYLEETTAPPEPEVIDLPISVNSSDLFKFMGSDEVCMYEEYHKRLNVVVGNSYRLTLTDDNGSYEATATATEESNPDIGITYVDLHFVFLDIPQSIDNVLGSISVDNGCYVDAETGEPSEDGFVWQVSINEEHTLNEFQSVVNTLTLSANS